ncbi:chemotaxis protein CheD [Occallatibacter riparius]|uniref:Probable chemoreceptor glutamine deamidase CheD n=1 Tax=Occallatibacter riparius TaxID=1002689 RepID=A0A9J7BMN2_9BACT|nr:chemotaxis protein CheD [Occallatibacter riparius]UWZ82453.1 chemotaxis protein CheD [Occallatibacter riparius]
MADSDRSTSEIYVQPGESHLVEGPAILRTLLGSCVGITFLVPRLEIGALCHPMLPRCPADKVRTIDVHAGRRYVDFAIREMARRLDSHGATRVETIVKIFGGNDVLSVNSDACRPTVGMLNRDSAIRVLEEEGYSISASCLGRSTGMHLTFHTQTGEVLVRRLDTSGSLTPQKALPDIRRHGRTR